MLWRFYFSYRDDLTKHLSKITAEKCKNTLPVDVRRPKTSLLKLAVGEWISYCLKFSSGITMWSSSETQGQSVRSREKARRKYSSTSEKAPGYLLSPDHFQTVKQMLAPDWAQKMLCVIVPNWRTASPEFFSCVRTRQLCLAVLYCTCLARSPRLRVQGKLLFSTSLTRNEGTNANSEKCSDAISKTIPICTKKSLFWQITRSTVTAAKRHL